MTVRELVMQLDRLPATARVTAAREGEEGISIEEVVLLQRGDTVRLCLAERCPTCRRLI